MYKQLTKIGKRQLPVLAFCLHEPFFDKYKISSNQGDFLANMKNFSVELLGVASGHNYIPVTEYVVIMQ